MHFRVRVNGADVILRPSAHQILKHIGVHLCRKSEHCLWSDQEHIRCWSTLDCTCMHRRVEAGPGHIREQYSAYVHLRVYVDGSEVMVGPTAHQILKHIGVHLCKKSEHCLWSDRENTSYRSTLDCTCVYQRVTDGPRYIGIGWSTCVHHII